MLAKQVRVLGLTEQLSCRCSQPQPRANEYRVEDVVHAHQLRHTRTAIAPLKDEPDNSSANKAYISRYSNHHL
jgi:hypothetical protein